MSSAGSHARTPSASGRSRVLTAILAAFGLGLGAPVLAQEQPPPRDPPGLAVQQGRISEAREAEAAQRFARARDAFESGRFDEALAQARDVVDLFPTAPSSGPALLIVARAALEIGSLDEADAAAERFVRLIPGDDPRAAELRLLQASAMERQGDPLLVLDRLLLIGSGADPATRAQATARARSAVDRLDPFELEELAGGIPPGALLAPIVQARFARDLREDGFHQRADAFARAALAGGAEGPDSLLADAVLRGARPFPTRDRPSTQARIATVLPQTGSPRLIEFGTLVAEGVEVAAATMLEEGIEVEVLAFDGEGDPQRAAATVSRLERERILGAVGFLEDLSLELAARGRRRDLPLVSPTARVADRAGPAVFALDGPDPRAAISIAEHAGVEGYHRVAIVHARTPSSTAEADAFEARARALGIAVAGRFAYEPGATYFGTQIRLAADSLRAAEIAALELGEEDTLRVEVLDPVALFVPLPFEDLEFAAPQITFFGLDTLAIDVLGTSGWTDPRFLTAVDQRHTSGVVATAPLASGPGSPGYIRFQQAYERHFQRSLVSGVPALGYDAALLLLEGARERARSPTQVRRAIERIREMEGANGIYSVIAGRVMRRTEVVRIEHGQLLPVGGFTFR